VLAAATLAVQAHADVQLPNQPARPVANYFLTVAATGERKTTVDTEALWPITKRETALRERYSPDRLEFENSKAAWDKVREDVVKKHKADRAAIKAGLDAHGPAPTPPLEPLLTCPEPTYEGMCKYLAIGQPSIGIFASEAGQFIGGHGMSDEAKLRTAAGLSAAWDGQPIKRVRGGDGAMVLPGRRVAMHLMAQPDVASIWLNDPLLANQGLLSRLLVTAPDSTSGTRMWREAAPQSDTVMKRYGARLLFILEMPSPIASGTRNELAPRTLPLCASAQRLWVGFHDYIEGRVGPSGELEPVRGLANKLAEHAGRIAAVLTLVHNIDAGEICELDMTAGIALAEHYAVEALRLFDASQANGNLRLAQRLLDWLLNQWTEPAISLPDIYQRSLNAVGDQATARRLVAILEEHDWLVKIPRGAVVAGQRRRDAWRIVREGLK